MTAFKPQVGSRLNYGHPLSQGVLGCWLMNEGSGDQLFDSGGNLYTGAFEGNAAWTTGSYGHAVNITDNSTDGVNVGKVLPTGTGTFTISTIVTLQDSAGRYAFSQWDSSVGLFVQNFGSNLNVYEGSNSRIVVDDFWVVGETLMLTIVYDGDQYHACSNGELIASSSTGLSAPDFSANTNFIWGNRDSGSRQFIGDISYGIVYNRALPPQEVAALYVNPYQMFQYPSLISYFDAGVPTTRPLPQRVLSGPFSGPLGGPI